MSETNHLGYCEGDICGRDGCDGVIELEPVRDCSCHISSPCWQHTEADMHCADCGWRAADDPLCVREISTISLGGPLPDIQRRPRVLDPSKVDWVFEFHTASSMIKKGVYPLNMSRQEVEEKVRGTFGGRFNKFKDGFFEYVAYTD